MILEGKIDESRLYAMLREIQGILGRPIRFRRYMYNMVLGLAMVTKGIHNLLDFDMEVYKRINNETMRQVVLLEPLSAEEDE